MIGTGESPPVGDELGTFGDALVDPLHDRGPVLGRVDGAHVDIGVETGADLEPLDPLFHERAQTIGGVANPDHQGLGHAALTSRAVAGGDRRVGGELHVGVGQDDHRILGGRVRPDALAVGGAGLVDVPTDRRRADKLNRVDTGVHQQGRDRLAPAVHNVEHTSGEARFLPQLGLELSRTGGVAGGLPDEGVTTGEGDRVDPHRHHHREVEGRDADGDPERLPERVGVDVRRDHRRVHPSEMHGQPASELDGLDPAHDLAERIRKGLAMITADEPGQILAVAVDELAIREEDVTARDERHIAPRGEGPPGGAHREVDLGRTATRDPGDDRPGRGIEDRSRPFRRDLDGAPIDPVTQDGNSAFSDCYWRRCHCGYLYKPAPAGRIADRRPLLTILRSGDLLVQMPDGASIIWTRSWPPHLHPEGPPTA